MTLDAVTLLNSINAWSAAGQAGALYLLALLLNLSDIVTG